MPTDFTKKTCREFVDALASSAPVPGGGGAAALAGALGTALGNMVGSLTVGKKKYADVEAEIVELKAKCDALQAALLDMVAEDARCFEPLAAAYGIPKDDPNRAAVMEDALKTACSSPMRIMELCCQAIEAIAVFAEKGSRIAVSDAGCGAALCKAALQSASLNVYINTRAMADRDAANALNDRANALLEKYVPVADSIFAAVRAGLVQ